MPSRASGDRPDSAEGSTSSDESHTVAACRKPGSGPSRRMSENRSIYNTASTLGESAQISGRMLPARPAVGQRAAVCLQGRGTLRVSRMRYLCRNLRGRVLRDTLEQALPLACGGPVRGPHWDGAIREGWLGRVRSRTSVMEKALRSGRGTRTWPVLLASGGFRRCRRQRP